MEKSYIGRKKAIIENGMRAIHPGEILKKEYLEPLGIPLNVLSKALDVPASRLNEIVRERRGITASIAMRLACFFDTTPQLWINLQMEYQLRITKLSRDSS